MAWTAKLEADTASTADGAVGVLGQVTSTAPGLNSAAVRGINADTGGNGGIGVWSSQAGSGFGVYGSGGYAAGYFYNEVRGTGISSSGYAGYFDGNVTVIAT